MVEKSKTDILLKYLKNNAYLTCREPHGALKFPYIEPGANYQHMLWDWDARFALEALIDLTEKLKNDSDFNYNDKKNLVINCGKGCVLNYLDAQYEDGFIPIFLPSSLEQRSVEFAKYTAGERDNQLKPVLCQMIKLVSDYSGDYNWFDVSKVEKYFAYYFNNQFNSRCNLFVWKNDLMVGVDNNPTVFFRPENSSADIYLNSFMFVELNTFSDLLLKIGDLERADYYKKRANDLKETINCEMYDKRDGFYYSQDVSLNLSVANRGYHKGFPISYKGLPIKIRSWIGLLPLWAGIPDGERAKEIIEKNFSDDSIFCSAGIRSLAKNEKMFSEKATNDPSNFLGPVWIINNILVWQGLNKYGITDFSEQLKERTVNLLSESVKNDGGFYESYTGDGKHLLFCGFLSWNLMVSEML